MTINAGAGPITLGNGSNVFLGAVSLNNSGANNILLANSGALVMGASNIGTGTLGILAGGSVSESGAILQTAGAGDVTL